MTNGDLRGWMRRAAMLAAACLVAGGAVILTVTMMNRPGRHSGPTHASFDPIYLPGRLVLTPRPLPANGRYLTADAAWAKWGPGSRVPSDVTARFGLLNDQGRYHLVWAYSEPGCKTLPGYRRHFSPAQLPTCRAWVFLAPKTGRMVLGIGGKIG